MFSIGNTIAIFHHNLLFVKYRNKSTTYYIFDCDFHTINRNHILVNLRGDLQLIEIIIGGPPTMHLRLKSAILSCKKYARTRKNRSITAVLRCIKFVAQVWYTRRDSNPWLWRRRPSFYPAKLRVHILCGAVRLRILSQKLSLKEAWDINITHARTELSLEDGIIIIV